VLLASWKAYGIESARDRIRRVYGDKPLTEVEFPEGS
jgi:hypothetical protein